MTIFVLGLDGASNENLEHAFTRTHLPNFKSILGAGSRRSLVSVYPYVTAPAWASMFSGVNPGKHGVFDMFQLKNDTLHPPNLRNSDVPFLWDYLSWAGKRVLILGIPFIHPAPEVNGIFVTGRFVPRMTFFPEETHSLLGASGYEYNEPWNKGRVKKNRTEEVNRLGRNEFGERLLADLERRITTSTRLLDRERWDVAVLVESLPDEVFHLCYENAAMVDRTWLLVDRLVGEVRARMKDDDAFFIVSDHGFSDVDRVLYINYWLRANGYLYPKSMKVPSAVSTVASGILGALRGRGGRHRPRVALEGSVDETERELGADDSLHAVLKTPHP
jgi:predicted AlkP superfamily phosphohydrolase/phosphomutase